MKARKAERGMARRRDIAPAPVLLEGVGTECLAGRRLPVTSLTALCRCGHCGLTLPICAFGRGQYRCRVLDFDHIGEKTAGIANLVVHEASLADLKREISQCEVRCANCHRCRTSQAGGHFRSRQP